VRAAEIVATCRANHGQVLEGTLASVLARRLELADLGCDRALRRTATLARLRLDPPTLIASTAALVGEAEDRLSHDVSAEYLTRWVIISAASLILVSLIGGLAVFGRRTKFVIAGVASLLAGGAVGFGYYVTLLAMGQTEAGSAACAGPEDCDTAFGLGAVLLTAVAGIAIGSVFVAAFGIKRLAGRLIVGD
jgi:hypothetical protein